LTNPGRFTQADVARLLKAARSAGYEHAIVVAKVDGSLELRVSSDKPMPVNNEWADLE
jgi:hypothetical protein